MMERHVRMGDRAVPIHSWRIINGRRVPVVKCETDETRHPDGRVDVTVKVPCLRVRDTIPEGRDAIVSLPCPFVADAGKEDDNG